MILKYEKTVGLRKTTVWDTDITFLEVETHEHDEFYNLYYVKDKDSTGFSKASNVTEVSKIWVFDDHNEVQQFWNKRND